MRPVIPPKAPNTPLPSAEYQENYFNQLLNVLRLYFNTLDNYFSYLGSRIGGTAIASPVAAFHDTTTQSAAVINTPYAVRLNTTDLSNEVRTDSIDNTKIVVNASAIYNIQFSFQLRQTSGSLGYTWIWVRVNGVDIPATATKIAIQGTGRETVAAWNFVIPLEQSEYVQLMWATDHLGVQLLAEPATAFCPSIPSAIVTVSIVSGTYT